MRLETRWSQNTMLNLTNREDRLDLLQVFPLLENLTSGQLESVESLVQWQSLPVRHTLVRHKEQGETICLLLEGYIKVGAPTVEGRELLLGVRGAGEVVGDMAMMDAAQSSATVTTLTPCNVALLDRDAFWTTLWDMPPIAYNLTHLLNDRVRRLSLIVPALFHPSASARLAFQLVTLADEFGSPLENDAIALPFALSIAELGGLTNIPEAEVARQMEIWDVAGIVSADLTDATQPLIVRDLANLRQSAGSRLDLSPPTSL